MANEKRMIDCEQAKRATYEEIFWTESEQAVVRNFLAKLPRVDAVEVVRCKDCKHYKNNRHNFYCDCDSVNECTDSCFFAPPDEDFYCRYGEKKDIVWKIADPKWERITNFNGIPLDGEERKDNG